MNQTIEQIIAFLKGIGIKAELTNIDQYGFSRTIQFKVDNTDCEIIWFKNESTLMINHIVSFPFKSISKDDTYPNQGTWIEFKYDNEWASLRIKIGV